jgi:UDP-2,3-diacylglucosamine hydrolase
LYKTYGQKIFFASDSHFGLPGHEDSIVREKRFVSWLDKISCEACEIFLLGDIFDFWFEYKKAVPRGFTRLLGKLASLTDNGIPVHFFTGNHDIWISDYLPAETGMIIHREPCIIYRNEKKIYLAHGDGLGPDDMKYKLIKKIFTNPAAQWVFQKLHPNTGIGFAHHWSFNNCYSRGEVPPFKAEEERLVIYSRELLQNEHFDFLIFGHRHLAVVYQLRENSKFVILGDWIRQYTYAVFDNDNLFLQHFTG